MTELFIRYPDPSDKAAWNRLWSGYLKFYEASVPECVTERTWARILDPRSSIFARLAERDGAVAGFSISVLHPSTWTSDPSCYLEDLFVSPEARGCGIGAALIDDLLVLAEQRGWERLYWHTQASNETARRLYDRYTQADNFVRYRLSLR